MNVQIDSSHQSNHPSLSILQKKLEEAGFRITDADSKVVLIVGEDPSGFSTAEVQNIEGFLEERFLGAELFLLARSFPFARVRCGINDSGQLIIAFPLSNETAQHLVHLLQMYFRRKNQGHLHAIKPVVPPSIGKQPLPAAGWIDNLHRFDFFGISCFFRIAGREKEKQ